MYRSEEELDAMAERDAVERENIQQDQIADLMLCASVNDLKAFIMKHVIGV